MPAKVFSAALAGLDAQPIEVEVDLSPGLHCFSIVGLPDAAVNEAKERVSSAIKNSGGSPPHHTNRRVVVNLAPADLKKEGSIYDLPIAIGYLLTSNQLRLKNTDLNKTLFVGELSLEGHVRQINGALPIALMAKNIGFETVFLPQQNAIEAALIEDLEIIPVTSLESLIKHLEGEEAISPQPTTNIRDFYDDFSYPFDMAYIKGQEHAKRALEIAAAGAHNILFSGPPGSGKTLLARTLPSILPLMTFDESLEVTKIFSISGCLPKDKPLVSNRPFRNPHHTASHISLVGGGANPRPGEITLAHRGVLFLDEFPEFNRQVLESLRQPLEDGVISVARAARTLMFPARFMLVASMNPCPCGKLTDPDRECQCSPSQVQKYKRRISGPLLDRIDLHIEVPPVKYDKLSSEKVAEESAAIRERVKTAREKQLQRIAETSIKTNSEMGVKEIKKFCQIDNTTSDLLKNAVQQLHLSARSFYRVLKLARTIADLASEKNIKTPHIAEALQYRPKEEF
ncbi:MAG: YifB family Mg chelatase-like AAA ATPase [Candidatus Portnoybacteria bacterium]|nr:YifB family Mg chelatase-like AAA ATPase [Candidatus Portnoybacteria bacterium]